MDKIKLPSMGDSNWGETLNKYLESLNKRLLKVEENTQINSSNNSIKYLGNAGSGVSSSTFDVNITVGKITGDFFFSGDINTLFKFNNDLIGIDDGKYGYRYLILSYDANNKFSLHTEYSCNLNYKDILLGFITPDDGFIQLFYSCTKTLNEHYQDMGINRSISLLNGLDVNLQPVAAGDSLTVGWTKSSGDNLSIRYDGIGNSKGKINNNLYLAARDYIVQKNTENYYCVKDSDDNITIVTRNENSAYDIIDSSNYYVLRLLVLLDGSLIVQQANSKYIPTVIDLTSSTTKNWLLNVPFKQNWSECTQSSQLFSLDCGPVEIARVCIKKREYQNPFNSQTLGSNSTYQSDVLWVQSLYNGLNTQTDYSLWSPKSNEIDLGMTSFYPNSAATNKKLKLNYDGAEEDTYNIYVDRNNLVPDDPKPTIMFTKMYSNNYSLYGKKDDSTTNSSPNVLSYNSYLIELGSEKLPLKLHYNQLSVGSGQGLISISDKVSFNAPVTMYDTCNMIGNLQISTASNIQFVSDRRAKENIKLSNLDCLSIVNNTPIDTYNYKGNNKHQLGIIAQDLEEQCGDMFDVFVNISKENGYDDFRTINETKLVYILWKALQQETQARKDLENKIKALEDR